MFQVLDAGRRNPIGAYLAITGRNLPFCFDQVVAQHSLQGRVERALLHLQQVIGALFDVLDQRVAVHGLAA